MRLLHQEAQRIGGKKHLEAVSVRDQHCVINKYTRKMNISDCSQNNKRGYIASKGGSPLSNQKHLYHFGGVSTLSVCPGEDPKQSWGVWGAPEAPGGRKLLSSSQ